MNKIKKGIDHIIRETALDENEPLLNSLIRIKEKLEEKITDHNKIVTAITGTVFEDIMLACPDCSSPVLLNYGNCPYCGVALLQMETQEQEPTEAEVKPKEDKKKVKVDPKPEEDKKKVKEKVEPKPVEDKVEAEDEDAYPSADAINELRRAGLTRVIKRYDLGIIAGNFHQVKELKKVVISAISALKDTEDDYPSEDEINGFNEGELTDTIKKYNMGISVKDYKSVKELRKAVNKAIDKALEDEYVETETVEDVETEEPTEAKPADKKGDELAEDDFDLDAIADGVLDDGEFED